MKKLVIISTILLLCGDQSAAQKSANIVSSPDNKITVTLEMSANKKPFYSIKANNETVLENSPLGIVREDQSFVADIRLISSSKIAVVKEKYELRNGKRLQCNYHANRRVFHLQNEKGLLMDIIFQVSNDGVAFRYYFPDTAAGIKKINAELTGFNFPPGSKAWLQPMQVAKSGWERTNPAYEEHYKQAMPVDSPIPSEAGWVFPSLFQSRNLWVLITETAQRNYCLSHLKHGERTNIYSIAFPDARESFMDGAVNPVSNMPWYSPWRIIAIGSLKTIAESTLGTDLADAPKAKAADYIKPGIASWSWILLKDNSVVFPVQKKYIDHAAAMHWQYCLIDADWDRKIGYDSIQILADYAKQKNVGLWLWYNSSGDWNTTKYSPKGKLLTHEARVTEFAKLKAIGIKGVKVDFFGGDGQSVINYYMDILEDAASAGLMVNCHGATLPRGLQRTYPNLLTMEAVRGYEMITFNQADADLEPTHCTMLPFTRNAFDPMDFTPMCLYKIPKINRKTTSAFELALTVQLTSGVQHLAEGPDGMEQMPELVKSYLRILPVYWDETKFIDGFPGKLSVIARRSGKTWYLSGINGESVEKELELDLSFLKNKGGGLFTDGSKDLDIDYTPVTIQSDGKMKIKLKANGGFVAMIGL